MRGVKTNTPFLENVLRHPEFLAGAPTTSFIERNAKELFMCVRVCCCGLLLFGCCVVLCCVVLSCSVMCVLEYSLTRTPTKNKQKKSKKRFEGHTSARAGKLLLYLADQVVNGPKHPGAVGAPPARYVPPPPAVPPELADAAKAGWRDVFVADDPDAWAK